MSFLEEMEAMRRREEAFRLLLLECLAEMEAEAGRLSVEVRLEEAWACPVILNDDARKPALEFVVGEAIQAGQRFVPDMSGRLIVAPAGLPYFSVADRDYQIGEHLFADVRGNIQPTPPVADAPGVPRIAAPLTASPDCHIGALSMPQADALGVEADGPLIVEPPEVPG